jgi:8-oxo-dGTP pyrophosphatase MutT (NUDIX family)
MTTSWLTDVRAIVGNQLLMIPSAVRETREETGLEVVVDSLHDVYAGPDFRLTYPNGDQGAYVMVAYRCSIVGGTATADGDEVSELRWVEQAELEALPTARWAKTVMPDAFRR